jgi:hypothetical protein
MATHWKPSVGSSLVFHERFGNSYRRTLTRIKELPSGIDPDVTIGVLDSDLPLKFHKVLPKRTDWEQYLIGSLCVSTNQFRQVVIRRIARITPRDAPTKRVDIQFGYVSSIPTFYQPSLIGGDSGNPTFLIIRGEPVLIETHTSGGPGSGPFFAIPEIYDQINQAMFELGGGHQLTPIEIN